MGSFLSGATGTGNSFQAEPIVRQNFLPGIQQSQGQFNQSFQNQNQLAAQLQAQAMGQGPNPAQIQLHQATDRNIAQNAGFLSSQKGLSPALAARLAAQNQANVGQQAAGQGALMGAQQQVGAMGQLANVYGQQQQGALGLQGIQQQGQANQNSAINGVSQINSGVAGGNQQMSGKLAGGAIGGIASAFGLAHGGMVPEQNFASGGFAQGFGAGFNGPSSGPQSQVGQTMAKPLFDLPGAVKGWFGGNKAPMSEDEQSGGLLGLAAKQKEAEESGLPLYGPGPSGVDFNNQTQMMPAAQPMGGMDMLRASKGAYVPGNAPVPGDSLQNDVVSAKLSPGEIVIPRHITMHPNAPEMAAKFVADELAKHGIQKKNYANGGVVDAIKGWVNNNTQSQATQEAEAKMKHASNPQNIPVAYPNNSGSSKIAHYADGGQVPPGLDANAPMTGLEPVSAGFDPGQALMPTPPRDYGQLYEQQYQQLRKLNPGEPDDFSRASALTAAEQAKKADTMAQTWNQERQVSGMQAGHDQAVAENTRRASLGLSPVPIPEAPAQVAMQSQAPQQQAPAPGLNEIPNMNPMAAMDQSMLSSYTKAANEQKAGYQQAAQAQDILGQQNAQIAHQEAAGHQKIMQEFQSKQQEYMQEYDHAMKDYSEGHINPNHYMENMSAFGKTRTAIGLILGGLSSGLTGQENPAAKFLAQQIDRDLNAQTQELGKKQNLLTANYHKLGNLKDATDMTRAMMMGFQSAQFKEAAAKAQGPMAKAVALQEAGKLDERIAPVMSQIAMRQAMMKGMNGGQMDPAMAIRFMAPEHQQAGLMKDLKAMQDMTRVRDNVLSAFDQVAAINTPMNRLKNPIQSSKQIDAIIEPVIAQASKETAGRYTEQDAGMLRHLLKASVVSDDKTKKIQRMRVNQLMSEKMNFPSLAPYGIKAVGSGRYDVSGKDRLPPLGPPKR